MVIFTTEALKHAAGQQGHCDTNKAVVIKEVMMYEVVIFTTPGTENTSEQRGHCKMKNAAVIK